MTYYDRDGTGIPHRRGASSGVCANRMEFDIKNNVVKVVDVLGRVALRTQYDLQSRRLRQVSIDAGDRRQLQDVTGRAIRLDRERHHGQDRIRRARAGPWGCSWRSGTVPSAWPSGSSSEKSWATPSITEAGLPGVRRGGGHDERRLRLRGEPRRADAPSPPGSSAMIPTGPWRWSSRPRVSPTSPASMRSGAWPSTGPDGTVTRPSYDKGGLLADLEANIRGGAKATVFLAGVEHNARGEPLRVELGNSAVLEYVYDHETYALRHLRSRRRSRAFQDLRYTYDVVGNVTLRRDGAREPRFFANSEVSAHADFTYDAMQRLVRASGRERVGQGGARPAPTTPPPPGRRTGRRCAATSRSTQAYDVVGNLVSVAHHASGRAGSAGCSAGPGRTACRTPP